MALAGAGENYFDGAIDDLHVFTGALTPAEVTALVTPIAGLAPAMQFDGVNDFVSVPAGIDLANQSFSVEFWAKQNGGLGAYRFIMSQNPGGTNNGSLHIGFRVAARQTVRRRIEVKNAGDEFLHAVHEEDEDGVSLRGGNEERKNFQRAGL